MTVDHVDTDRPAVLRVVEAMMRSGGDLLDPDMIGRVSELSGVDRATIVLRWGTGASLIADMVSERALAAPGLPDESALAGASGEVVLSALVGAVNSALEDEEMARSALSQAFVSPVVRTLWFDFVRDSADRWVGVLANAWGGQRGGAEDRAERAVSVVVGQCYSRLLLGGALPQVTDEQIVRLASTA